MLNYKKSADSRHTPLGSPQTITNYERSLRVLRILPMLIRLCGSFNFRGGDSEAIELFIYMSWMRIVSAHTAKVVIYFNCVWGTCEKKSG